ncbi:heterokaryon incompatibility protein-domain-containing protein [Echria macrotheca]|uniref:Heterokaryon incompatibility protein-domain-containing protein n=1 Tax=Echria macrotheca TaxID=438768 RepID=A0AAJ0BLK9_9PEZI|nr:heterokaryon incompatibility protein-domain-containing protein [Echria macrotheca]
MALCSRCQRFDIQAFAPGRVGRSRGYPLTAVKQAAADGCCFCKLVLESFRMTGLKGPSRGLEAERYHGRGQFSPLEGSFWARIGRSLQELIDPRWVHFDTITGIGASDESLRIKKLTASVNGWKAKTSIHLAADEETPASVSGDIIGRISDSVRLPDIETIREWYINCQRNHPECNKSLSQCESFNAEEVPLPARLVKIDISDTNTGDAGHPDRVFFQLCDTEGLSGKYIALTHRWDESTEASRTLKGNLEGRKAPDELAWNYPQLSTVFLEAALCAYRLGVQYIWIDTLCIVQDDPVDWSRESGKMADYYQHALLTIVATAAVESRILFKQLRVEDISKLARLPYRDRNGECKGYFYAQSAEQAVAEEEYLRQVYYNELFQRGWTFQEFTLSRRLLTFTNGTVYMQCQNKRALSLTGESVGYQKFAIETLSSPAAILDSWEIAAATFSSLQFTKIDRDRFVALAGVVSEFHQAIHAAARGRGETEREFHNAFGHWFENGTEGRGRAARALLWRRIEPIEGDPFKPQHGELVRAAGVPTWSWASMGCRSSPVTGKESMAGMGVRWPVAREFDKSSGFRMVCSAEALRPPEELMGIQLNTSAATSFPTAEEYAEHSEFRVLRIHGRVYQLSIRGQFADDEDRVAATKLSRRRENLPRRLASTSQMHWRRVSLNAAPEFTIGWASLEDPDFQTDEALSTCGTIYALFVARTPRIQGGYEFGNVTGYHTAFQVLFLTKVNASTSDDCYQRIGYGRLFGNDVDKCFGSVAEETIWLL